MCRGTCAILKALQKCTEHAKPARATNARQFFLLDSPPLNITRAGRVAPVQILLALIFSASSYSIYTPRRPFDLPRCTSLIRIFHTQSEP